MRQYETLKIGDAVQVVWGTPPRTTQGTLKKLPSGNEPYWEIYGDKGSGYGIDCVCAFAGTVFVVRLASGVE